MRFLDFHWKLGSFQLASKWAPYPWITLKLPSPAGLYAADLKVLSKITYLPTSVNTSNDKWLALFSRLLGLVFASSSSTSIYYNYQYMPETEMNVMQRRTKLWQFWTVWFTGAACISRIYFKGIMYIYIPLMNDSALNLGEGVLVTAGFNTSLEDAPAYGEWASIY